MTRHIIFIFKLSYQFQSWKNFLTSTDPQVGSPHFCRTPPYQGPVQHATSMSMDNCCFDPSTFRPFPIALKAQSKPIPAKIAPNELMWLWACTDGRETAFILSPVLWLYSRWLHNCFWVSPSWWQPCLSQLSPPFAATSVWQWQNRAATRTGLKWTLQE